MRHSKLYFEFMLVEHGWSWCLTSRNGSFVCRSVRYYKTERNAKKAAKNFYWIFQSLSVNDMFGQLLSKKAQRIMEDHVDPILTKLQREYARKFRLDK